jgi:hypothetical protein
MQQEDENSGDESTDPLQKMREIMFSDTES